MVCIPFDTKLASHKMGINGIIERKEIITKYSKILDSQLPESQNYPPDSKHDHLNFA